MSSQSTKLRIFIAALLIGIASLCPLLPTTTFADSICDNNKISDEIKAANGCGTGSPTEISNVVTNILNAVILVSGIVAVIFIVVGGVQYMTSTGESSKVEKAKKTILYSVIGLIVCALSFAIVNFVIIDVIGNNSATPTNGSTNNTNTTKSPSTYTSSSSCTAAGYHWDQNTKQCKP